MKLTNKGQTLVEILLAMGLMAIILPALLTGFVASRESKPQKERRQKATALLRETGEALRSVRESDWYNLSTNETYHPQISGTRWVLSLGAETTAEGFAREIVISDVQRDLTGAITQSEGTIDPSTRQADISVSWTTPIPSSVTATSFLTRYLNNLGWEQTTQSEFTNGTNVNVSIVNNDGGEIELTASTGGDWSSPTEVDTYNAVGSKDGFSVFTLGNYFYLGSDSLYIIDISDPLNISLTGTYSTGADVFDIYVEGNYAYLGTSRSIKVMGISLCSAVFAARKSSAPG